MAKVTPSSRIEAALKLPNGARFYRCAFQVNPFQYLVRHQKQGAFRDEASYNAAIISACKDASIEVIGVTDHYRVKHSHSLVKGARDAGLWAFNGFEAVTKDGVHFLCLFDPDKDERIERFIGECGVHSDTDLSPTGHKDTHELLECARNWGGICIAAHVAADAGGLLKKLSGQTRAKAWKCDHLLACALPGPVDQAPEALRSILKNENPEYRRTRQVAVINASDVNDPDDLKKDGSSCYIKMSTVSIEALRQAFLDPQSRVRLHSDPQPEPHTEFVAITWEGGFLTDTAVHLNGNLNVLVGGRGTGKSTMIESLRYALALDPLGEDARKAHEGVVRNVLRPGTKVSVLVRSHKPSQRSYTIERSVPNPAVVKDENGEVLTLSPKDVVPGVEIFGQHEISELTKSREKLTFLLNRFVDHDASIIGRKAKLRLELERSRSRIVASYREVKAVEERLAALPGLEETQKRFQEAGLETRLKEKSLLIKEDRVFADLNERLNPLRTLHKELTETIPIDSAFVSVKALEGLPNVDILRNLDSILVQLSADVAKVSKEIGSALTKADAAISEQKSAWLERRKKIEERYEKLLRELQTAKIDGAEFIRLRQRIEELRPLRERIDNLKKEISTQEAIRRKLVSEWEDLKASEYREIQKAAKKVSRHLHEKVRVEVTMAGNREPLELLLREVGGNLNAALDRLRSHDQLSLPDFSQRCREGRDALAQNYKLPAGAAERIAQADLDLHLRIEELDLAATTQIELNTAPDGATTVNWQTLEDLSTGQKATAVLLLLLLESDAPLIVDQPEDDLDNRFITEGVVPTMRIEKRRRQFVFSTHNANIPVLGDAELIIGLSASGEGAKVSPDHMSSIDSKPVRELVEEILEGGKEAFEMRRSKYGF